MSNNVISKEYFSDDFLDKLPDDDVAALNLLCLEFKRLDADLNQDTRFLQDYLDALAVYNGYRVSRDFSVIPSVNAPDPHQAISTVRELLYGQLAETTRQMQSNYLDRTTRKYADRFNNSTVYTFLDDDYAHIQKLINEMREIVSNSQVITARHKNRLLERLERMQKELHKRTSDLDRFWGFIGEAGIVLGKFGQDSKPLVDRTRELISIVWRVIAVSELLLGQGDVTPPPIISIPDLDKDNRVTT
jgi:hypothetical protein